uniref:Uncharacterized protein n=1 Tax=Arundo donax TaxID=35708 RepID=A0A0A9ECT8_ARUDO
MAPRQPPPRSPLERQRRRRSRCSAFRRRSRGHPLWCPVIMILLLEGGQASTLHPKQKKTRILKWQMLSWEKVLRRVQPKENFRNAAMKPRMKTSLCKLKKSLRMKKMTMMTLWHPQKRKLQ